MRRQPLTRPENVLALAVAEIERIKALLSRVTDGRSVVVETGTGPGDTTVPVEAGTHTLYGIKHTRAFRVTDGGGLDIDYEQGQTWTGGSFYSVGAGSLTLDDNTTNYVFINSAGAVAYNATGFPADSTPLAQVTTVAGDITALVDRRSYLLPGAGMSGSMHDPDQIIDADGDTSVEVEQAADEDIIRLTAATVEVGVIGVAGQWQLPVVGAGAGVLIGGDTQLYRSAADILMLAAGDTLAINDANFTLALAAGNPTITFDANDYLIYVRGNNYYSFYIGSTEMLTIQASGQAQLPVTGAGAGLLFGGDAQWYRSAPDIMALGTGDRLRVDDANFVLWMNGANPRITLGADAYLEFDRATNNLNLALEAAAAPATMVFRIDARATAGASAVIYFLAEDSYAGPAWWRESATDTRLKWSLETPTGVDQDPDLVLYRWTGGAGAEVRNEMWRFYNATGDALIADAQELQFRDSDLRVYSAGDGILSLASDFDIRLVCIDVRISEPGGGNVAVAITADHSATESHLRLLPLTGTNAFVWTTGTGFASMFVGNAAGIEAMRVAHASGAIDILPGLLGVGIEDTTQGFLTLYGAAGGSDEGGQISLRLAADHDAVFNEWTVDVFQNDLRLFTSDAATINVFTAEGQLQLPRQGSGAGVLIGGDVQLYRSAADTLYIPDSVTLTGTLQVGANDSIAGQVILWGDSASQGGRLDLFIGAAQDATWNYWTMRVLNDDDLTWYVADPVTERMRLVAEGMLKLPTTGSAAGILIGGDVHLYRSAANVLYIPDSVAITGDLYFETDSGGLPYGCMHGYNISETVAVGVVDTWYELTAGLSSAETNLETFQNNHELKVTRAGRYAINWSMAVQSSTANDEFEGAITINNTANTTTACHATLVKANASVCLSGGAVLDLAANDVISVAVLNHTTNRDIMVEHVTVTVVMVGGT
jgi:hypothetical protein